MATIPLALALVLATSFVSGVLGVAGGLILMGGLVQLLPIAQAMIVHGLAQFVSNVSRVVHWRRYVVRWIVAQFLLATLVAVAIFAVVRFVPSKPVLLLALGLSTLVVVLLPANWAPRITHRGVPYLCGLVGTALILTTGVSGTFLDQFFQGTGLDRRTIVATKAAMQVAQHALKVAYFSAITAIGIDGELIGLMALVPFAAFAGASMARHVLERMTDRQFAWWTRRVVLVLALYYVVDGLRLLFA